MIELTLDDSDAKRGLAQLLRNATNNQPMMKGLAIKLESMTTENFESESWGGDKWKELRYSPKGKGKKLHRSGELEDSITSKTSENFARIGSNMVYAAIHHMGGKTSAHKIVPKNKKGLAFGGIVRKAVNHPGSEIDPRPYLPINGEGKLQDDGEERLLDVVVAALKKDVYR